MTLPAMLFVPARDRLQPGFTLVELAIVITIIGLLIGGVLKGQELLENARLTSLQSQWKSYNTAITTFRDIYKALPGDIINPANYIQNCTTAPCSNSGDGNGMIGTAANMNASSAGSPELQTFWLHLSAANLVSGINASASPSAVWGGHFPAASIGGGWAPQYIGGSGIGGVDITPGHYLTLRERVTSTNSASWYSSGMMSDYGGAVRGNMASKIELKMDDGLKQTGEVLGAPGYGCNTVSSGAYDVNDTAKCNLAFKIQ